MLYAAGVSVKRAERCGLACVSCNAPRVIFRDVARHNDERMTRTKGEQIKAGRLRSISPCLTRRGAGSVRALVKLARTNSLRPG